MEHRYVPSPFCIGLGLIFGKCIVTYILLELDPPRFRHEFDAESKL